METIYLQLMPANRNCDVNLKEIAKLEYDGSPIFEYACRVANESSSFSRSKRKMQIREIGNNSIIVKLESERHLDMASKALSGFSRTLLKIAEELKSNTGKNMFDDFVYNKSLFRNVPIAENEIQIEVNTVMTDVDAVKNCVELFMDNATLSKEEIMLVRKTRDSIKKVLKEYEASKRTLKYAKMIKNAKEE